MMLCKREKVSEGFSSKLEGSALIGRVWLSA